MFLERVGLISVILTVVSAAPRITRSTVPKWHLPCGTNLELEISSMEDFEEETKISLNHLRLQHQLTLREYLNRDYEYLYDSVRFGVHDHQYVPNWVPGKKDVNLVRGLAKANTQTIINHFPKFHMDLQKFAVAFEQLVKDEPDTNIRQALKTTQSYLMMLLCEVENNILIIPSLELPTRVERSIMSNMERNPIDDTKRHIRDWGVILKYRNYLHAWRSVFNY